MHVLEFYKHIGRSCLTLGDLNWPEVSAYLDRIPTDLERVTFLHELSRLPDDGVVNNSIVNPAVYNRNRNTILRPLNDECTRLLARHFNIENILREAEGITNHLDAIDYLWRVIREFKKYHPGTLNGQYSSGELRFCNRIHDEIQYRKDVQANGSPTHYSMTIGENRGNIQQGETNHQNTNDQDNSPSQKKDATLAQEATPVGDVKTNRMSVSLQNPNEMSHSSEASSIAIEVNKHQAFVEESTDVVIALHDVSLERKAVLTITFPGKERETFSSAVAGDIWRFESNGRKYRMILLEASYIKSRAKLEIRRDPTAS